MDTEETEAPAQRLTRRQFLKRAAVGTATAVLASACKPKSPEAVSISESVTSQLKNQLESAFATAGENLAVGMVEEQFPGYTISEGNIPFFCLPSGGEGKESPYQVGYLKAGEGIFLHHRVVTVDKANQEKGVWNVLLFDREQGLPDKWEFIKIGGWDENRMSKQLETNKEYLINVNNQLALFCFDGAETERISRIASEPIAP